MGANDHQIGMPLASRFDDDGLGDPVSWCWDVTKVSTG
jgi:hypothetical protein